MTARSEKLTALIAEFTEDDAKVGINNSAATRARKKLTEIKKLCGEFRDAIQAERAAAK